MLRRILKNNITKPSAKMSTLQLSAYVGIENNLHWNLDVIFKEDNQVNRNQTAIENSNLIAKLAITLLDNEKKQ